MKNFIILLAFILFASYTFSQTTDDLNQKRIDLMVTGNYEAAYKICDKITEYSKAQRCFLKAHMAYSYLNDISKAETFLNDCLALEPEHYNALYLMGFMLFKEGTALYILCEDHKESLSNGGFAGATYLMDKATLYLEKTLVAINKLEKCDVPPENIQALIDSIQKFKSLK